AAGPATPATEKPAKPAAASPAGAIITTESAAADQPATTACGGVSPTPGRAANRLATLLGAAPSGKTHCQLPFPGGVSGAGAAAGVSPSELPQLRQRCVFLYRPKL